MRKPYSHPCKYEKHMGRRESPARARTRSNGFSKRTILACAYLTLRHLLKREEGDAEVEQARKEIMRIGPVPKILAKQSPEGHWGRPEDFYMRSKYQGTIWNLIVLAELYADPEDERIRRACESVLKWSQNPASGGFSTLGTAEKGGKPEMEIPCLTANMAFSMVRLGMLDDPRVQKALRWIVRYQRFDLQPFASKEWPYQYDHCWRKHTCRSSVAKALKALTEVPEERRTRGMRAAIENAREFFLVQNIYRKGTGLQGDRQARVAQSRLPPNVEH